MSCTKFCGLLLELVGLIKFLGMVHIMAKLQGREVRTADLHFLST